MWGIVGKMNKWLKQKIWQNHLVPHRGKLAPMPLLILRHEMLLQKKEEMKERGNGMNKACIYFILN
jgi:hypothetical protein